jgi:hypothetical protein
MKTSLRQFHMSIRQFFYVLKCWVLFWIRKNNSISGDGRPRFRMQKTDCTNHKLTWCWTREEDRAGARPRCSLIRERRPNDVHSCSPLTYFIESYNKIFKSNFFKLVLFHNGVLYPATPALQRRASYYGVFINRAWRGTVLFLDDRKLLILEFFKFNFKFSGFPSFWN